MKVGVEGVCVHEVEVKHKVRTVKSACTLLPFPVAGDMRPPTGAYRQSNAPKATTTDKALAISSLCGTSSTKGGPSNSWQRPNGTQGPAQGYTQPR